MVARIFKPARSAMQSGMAASKMWHLEYEPEARREVEPLMGWTSSGDMKSQIRLKFATRQEAIDYARRNAIAYRVEEPRPRKIRPKSYADNFRSDRKDSWTH